MYLIRAKKPYFSNKFPRGSNTKPLWDRKKVAYLENALTNFRYLLRYEFFDPDNGGGYIDHIASIGKPRGAQAKKRQKWAFFAQNVIFGPLKTPFILGPRSSGPPVGVSLK